MAMPTAVNQRHVFLHFHVTHVRQSSTWTATIRLCPVNPQEVMVSAGEIARASRQLWIHLSLTAHTHSHIRTPIVSQSGANPRDYSS
jgi:hypothetical protein